MSSAGFTAVLSYSDSGLVIRGVALNYRQAPGTCAGGRPGYLFIIFHEETKLSLSGKSLRCRPGDMIILPPDGTRPAAWPPCRISWLEAGEAWLKRLLQRQGLPLNHPIRLPDRWAHLKHLAGIYGYLFLHNEPHSQALRNLLQNWMQDTVRAQTAKTQLNIDPMLMALREHIDMLYDQPWRLRDMSSITGMSVSSLVSHFRQAYGYTPMQYVLRRRMLHAAGLLLYSRHTVSQAAREVGCESASGFARSFRKYIGVGPEEWRQGRGIVDESLLRSVNLQRARVLVMQGRDEKWIARETGFGDLESMRRAYTAHYGTAFEVSRLFWLKSDALGVPQDSIKPSHTVGHHPAQSIFSMGWLQPHRAEIETTAAGTGLLCMVFHDDVEVELSGRMALCPAGSLVILTSGSRRCFGNTQRPWRNSWIWGGSPWLGRQISNLGLPLDRVIRLPGPTAAQREFLSLRGLLLGQQDPDATMVRRLLQNWLLEIQRLATEEQKGPDISSLTAVRRHMENHFGDSQSLEALTAGSGYSRDWFGRLFKAAYGMSPMRYLASVRMLQAISLMADGNLSLRQAARETGYTDVELFSDNFRLYFGIRPAEVLAANRSASLSIAAPSTR